MLETTELRPSPAPFNDKVLAMVRDMIHHLAIDTILDPFAGTGRIHELRPRRKTFGIEREPEWANHKGYAEAGWTVVGDCLNVMEAIVSGTVVAEGWPMEFDALISSPTYGNRMADHHDAKDDSVRNTYKHKLGRDLSDNNSGAMPWGDEYRNFHRRAWMLATDVVKDGYFVLNMKDHIRAGERQHVTLWHIETLKDMGWRVVDYQEVSTTGNRFGANSHLRVDYEAVILLERRQ